MVYMYGKYKYTTKFQSMESNSTIQTHTDRITMPSAHKRQEVPLIEVKELIKQVEELKSANKRRDEHYRTLLEQEQRRYEKAVHKNREHYQNLVRKQRVASESSLNQVRNELNRLYTDQHDYEKTLLRLHEAHQKQIKSLVHPDPRRKSHYHVSSFSYGAREARIFLCEFEFYCQINRITTNYHLLQTFSSFLTGHAAAWMRPIITNPERFPYYYQDFNIFLHDFQNAFCNSSSSSQYYY
ncbi:hypothetical protein TRVA0_001S02586 [Trichomonascus vanleenenianus]|uniref:uncharacterized protein n=1 Tax=Trichomonascus vanleenenianus TaxID=2268995 RepID=UPI003ECA69D3